MKKRLESQSYLSEMAQLFPTKSPVKKKYLRRTIDCQFHRLSAGIGEENEIRERIVHEALGEARDTWVKELADFFDRVNAEDRVVVEGINRGAQAPLATRGPLSWLEREIHDFARYLSARLNGPAKEKRKAR